MKIKVNKTSKILLTSLVFAAACFAAAAFFTYLFKEDSTDLVKTIERVAIEEAEEYGKIQVSNLFEESAEERDHLRQFVLTEGRLIDFVSEIEGVAAEQQLEFETVQIDDVSDKKKEVGEYAVTFEFMGARDNTRKMIEILETLPYHGRVEAVTLMDSRQSWRAVVSMRLSVISYD